MAATSLVGLTLHVADIEKSLDFYKRISGAAHTGSSVARGAR